MASRQDFIVTIKTGKCTQQHVVPAYTAVEAVRDVLNIIIDDAQMHILDHLRLEILVTVNG